MRIALDAMGGDRAPDEIVRGAVESVRLGYLQPSDLVLVGDEPRIRSALSAAIEESAIDGSAMQVHHAPEVVEMHEKIDALRRKKRSSIGGCVRLVKDGEADAFVSAGNTGAVVAASTLHLRLIEGIRRPGIAITLPSPKGGVTVIDVGANIKCTPVHLFQYGLMAHHYVESCRGIEHPRIGLLNIGSEDQKGNEVVRKTRELFSATPLNFVGNVEGQDVFADVCDIVVCEGFVGNVVLKVSEGISEFLVKAVAGEVSRAFPESETPDGWKVAWTDIIGRLLAKIDYSEYGGAPLLGIDGTCIIGHGRSDAKAIANALRTTRDFVRFQVNSHIRSELAQLASLSGDLPSGATGETGSD
ncbi:MAG: phosphate acyltransferase PlsX [Planctomycetota bacterium]